MAKVVRGAKKFFSQQELGPKIKTEEILIMKIIVGKIFSSSYVLIP